MNSNSPPRPTHSFGPVLVLSKKPSSTGSTVAVRLCQAVTTTYPPGSRPHLNLQESLASVPETVTSCRKATQRLLPAEADKLNEGDEVGGHICRVIRATPRWAEQKPAYEGGYASSYWSATYVEDEDLREVAAV